MLISTFTNNNYAVFIKISFITHNQIPTKTQCQKQTFCFMFICL